MSSELVVRYPYSERSARLRCLISIRKETIPMSRTPRYGRSTHIALCGMACVLVGYSAACAGQGVKTRVIEAPLAVSPLALWTRDLGYTTDQLHPITFAATKCPLVQVDVSGVAVWMMFDTGTSRGFVLTTHAPSAPHTVTARTAELNADGTHRGESITIRVDSLTVFGETFRDVQGSLADWRMFSSEPFDGTLGLDFFRDRRVTLDYAAQRIALTTAALPDSLDPNRYLVIDLITPPPGHGSLLYARARVNGRDALLYLDTGYSVSFIDPAFADGLARVERTGHFPNFREHVPLDLGGKHFLLDELREDPIRRGPGFDLPVALTLGSDFLSRFVVTVDTRVKKLVLALAAGA